MENKIIFREMLSEIREAADAAGGVITQEAVRGILAGMPLEEEHFQFIYDYLAEQKIRVVKSMEEAEELPEEEERRSLSIYLEELMQMEENPEEEHALLEQVLAGDEQARTRLIEAWLPRVCEMAGEYEGKGIPAEDLIQEGNIGLLTAMETLQEYRSPAACRAHILNSVSQAMEQAIKEGEEEHRMDAGIVSRVNHLNEAVQNLERDLEHKVTAEELSAYLEMPLEEIDDLLRMSGDQIELEGRQRKDRN